MTATARHNGLRELTEREIDMVSGGLSLEGAAGLTLALGAIGGPTTLAFAVPVAGSLVAIGAMEDMRDDGGS